MRPPHLHPVTTADPQGDPNVDEVFRYRDPVSGAVAEVGTDGVPVGLAFPASLLTKDSREIARILLYVLTASADGARELLEQQAEQEWYEPDGT